MHFCITWVIFQQFSRRDVKLVAFLIIFHLLNYTSPQTKISLLWSRINAKKWVFVVPYHISWQRIAICCVVTVDCGHFSCHQNSRIGFSKPNVYVNELNIVLLYEVCPDEFKYRYNASNLYRVTHDNGGWRRLTMVIAAERCWVERYSCKGSRTEEILQVFKNKRHVTWKYDF